MDLTGYKIDFEVADSDRMFYVVTVVTPEGLTVSGTYESMCDFEPGKGQPSLPEETINAISDHIWDRL